MSRVIPRSQRVFAISLGLTLLCAVLPVGWLRWTGVVANVFSVPVQPLADAGLRLGLLMRPGLTANGSNEVLRQRDEELQTTRALLHGARIRIEALLEEIDALQEARRFHRAVEMTPLYARVTGAPPDRGSGPVRLNVGSRHGVVPYAIAIYRGGHLVGRVAGDVSRLSSRLVPLTDPSTGLVEGLILPAGDPIANIAQAPRIQLFPDGHGGLGGDLDRELAVSVGDVVRLADPGWPQSAQGLIVGTVESIEPNDHQPLRVLITVRPTFEAKRLDSVTLLVERFNDALGGEQP